MDNNKTININNLVRKNVLNMTAYASARSEFKGQADIFLDANESPFDNQLNRYPDPLQKKVKNKISEIKNVSTEHIFLGNGSDEAIDLLIRIFCEPGVDHIITLPPTYGMYKVSAALSDIEIKTVPLTSNFQPDETAIISVANSHSKILFLCSPNNPTGNAFDPTIIKSLIEKFSGIVVIDEAYLDFSSQPSFNQLINDYSNLVILQTFSKAWGLAGIRLGMAFSDTPIIELLNKTKPPYNINQLTQSAVLKQLENKRKITEQIQLIIEQRKWLSTQLNQIPLVEKVFPSDANFLLVRMHNDATTIYHYLIDQKIIVRNRSSVILCDNCLRFTVGTPEENQQLINCLNNFK